MLSLIYNNTARPIEDTEYYVRQLASGLDEVIFQVSIHDPTYKILSEEMQVIDRAGQTYLVKQIDGGANFAKVICSLDLDDWKAQMFVDWGSGSNTLYNTITSVKPAGWTLVDLTGSEIRRTIDGSFTPFEIVLECAKTYSIYPRWDNKTKTLTLYPTTMQEPVGSFATRELNLREINYKGKSTEFATRLYAYGKDGLTFASINDNKPYVEDHTYSEKIVCAYWQDERYTVKESLLADARARLAELAIPKRSYDCQVVDLQAADPETYGHLTFDLLTTATLIDDIKGTSINYQVVERHEYPYHPEKNTVVFNTSPATITSDVRTVSNEVANPNSGFNQGIANKILSATEWLTKGDGYILCVLNDEGAWQELLFLDAPTTARASRVLRINQYGIGFASGTPGTFDQWTYAQSWTLDGILSLGGVNNRFGVLVLKDQNARTTAEFSNEGIWLDAYNSGGTRVSTGYVYGDGMLIEAATGNAGATLAAGEITVSDTDGTTSTLSGSAIDVGGVNLSSNTVTATNGDFDTIEANTFSSSGSAGVNGTSGKFTFTGGICTDIDDQGGSGVTDTIMVDGNILYFEDGILVEVDSE